MRPRTPFQRIDISRAEALLSRSNVVILDVRDVVAFHESHLDGAHHVSSANLPAVIGSTANTRPILIYCYHGNASREYAQIFSDFGFAEVYSLDGGHEAWRTGHRRESAACQGRNCSTGWLPSIFHPPTSTPPLQTPRHR